VVHAEDGDVPAFVSFRDGAGRELPSGLYFSRLEVGSRVQSKKMTLIR
jgi:hypothetical protein